MGGPPRGPGRGTALRFLPAPSARLDTMSQRDRLGGIIHPYQKYAPAEFPSPTAPPPDLVSPAFEHLLYYGNTRRLTDEELARAVSTEPRPHPRQRPRTRG